MTLSHKTWRRLEITARLVSLVVLVLVGEVAIALAMRHYAPEYRTLHDVIGSIWILLCVELAFGPLTGWEEDAPAQKLEQPD